jgi:hypothetical protein
MFAVTPEDCLKGEKEITVALRRGGERKLIVRALNWREALEFSQLSVTDPTACVLRTVKSALPQAEAKDERLNEIVPFHLTVITETSLLLSNGVDAAKKRTAAMAAAPQSPDSRTISPPNANSGSTDTPMPADAPPGS